MNSNTVLNNVRDEMTAYIKSSRSPYQSDIAQVIRGAHSVKQAVNKPYVGIHMINDTPYKIIMGCNDLWEVIADIYCYMDPEIVGVYDELHQMKDDIIYFLTNDCSHRDNLIVNGFSPVESGVVTVVNYFALSFTVRYEYSPT